MRRTAILVGLLVVLGAGLAVWAGPTGKVKIDTPGMVVEVEMYGQKVALPPLREVPVARGTLETKGIKLHAKGRDTKNRPAIWRLDGTGPFGDLKEIEVKTDEVTTVEGGAPLTVLTPTGVSTKGGRRLTVGLQFVGKAKEHYRTVVYMGRRRAPAPKIALVDESGKVLDTGNFEYG
ncbi:MAG: hypothetical protein R6X20_10935 [Phycisphaerae bacterium]